MISKTPAKVVAGVSVFVVETERERNSILKECEEKNLPCVVYFQDELDCLNSIDPRIREQIGGTIFQLKQIMPMAQILNLRAE